MWLNGFKILIFINSNMTNKSEQDYDPNFATFFQAYNVQLLYEADNFLNFKNPAFSIIWLCQECQKQKQYTVR